MAEAKPCQAAYDQLVTCGLPEGHTGDHAELPYGTHWPQGGWRTQKASLRALEASLAQWKRLFDVYGQHLPACPRKPSARMDAELTGVRFRQMLAGQPLIKDPPCTCGFDDVVEMSP